MKLLNQSRREFLRTAAALSAVGPAGAGFALNLAGIGAAAAQTAQNDYKALVCLFMFGGNDYANTVLAHDGPSWARYLAARDIQPDPVALNHPDPNVPQRPLGTGQTVAPPRAVAIAPNTVQNGRLLSIHPNLGTQNPTVPNTSPAFGRSMKSVFDEGRLAIAANVGPLIVPTTKAQYNARSVPLPPRLFSHNDQQSTWMAFGPEGAATGWGGRLGDLFAASNADPVFTSLSLAGNQVWLNGQRIFQYQIGTNGPVQISGLNSAIFGSSGASAVLRPLTMDGSAHLIEREIAKVTKRSEDARNVMTSVVNTTALNALAAGRPTSNIASQLAAVAQIIAGRGNTGAKRQVFFVSMGGFDNHDLLNTGHGNLMRQLGDALEWFDRALANLGGMDMRASVTTFTASDFGRTLTSNGDGSDHGWGGHHFVMGGAVRGRDVYGRFPEIGASGTINGAAYNNTDDVGQGRLLPGMAVDQYAAALGRWFGASDTDLMTVMPNLKNFGSTAAQAIGPASFMA